MSERSYDKAIIDTCFISALYRVDSSCKDLLYLISEYYSDTCVVIDKEYNNSSQPCNQIQHPCETDKKLITNTESMKYLKKNNSKLNRIFNNVGKYANDRQGVHPDITILSMADKYAQSIILSCDRNLLKACRKMILDHLCMKAALVEFDTFIGFGDVFEVEHWRVQHMINGNNDEWSFHFNNDKGCKDCKSDICDFSYKRDEYIKRFKIQ